MTTRPKSTSKHQIRYFAEEDHEPTSLAVQHFLPPEDRITPMGGQVLDERSVQCHSSPQREVGLYSPSADERLRFSVRSYDQTALYENAMAFLKQATVFHPLYETNLSHLFEDLSRATRPRITRNMWRVLSRAALHELNIDEAQKRTGLSYQATAAALRQLHDARILRRIAVPDYSSYYLSPFFVLTNPRIVLRSNYMMSTSSFVGGKGLRSHYFLYPSSQLPALKDHVRERGDLVHYVGEDACIRETCSLFLMNPETRRFEASHDTLLKAALIGENRTRERRSTGLFNSRTKLLKTDVQLAYYLSHDLEIPNRKLAGYLDRTVTYISERKKYNLRRGFLSPRNVFGHLGLDEMAWFLFPASSMTGALVAFFDHLPLARHYRLMENSSQDLLHGILVQGPLGLMTLVSHFLSLHLNISSYNAYSAPNQNDRFMPQPGLFLESTQSWELDEPEIVLR